MAIRASSSVKHHCNTSSEMVGLAISQSAIEHSKSMHQKPDPDAIHPIVGYDKEIYAKPTIRNPNTVVGDFTYIAESEFESHATHQCELLDGRLILPDCRRRGFCHERCEPPDERRVNLSVLHAGGQGDEASGQRRSSVQGCRRHRKRCFGLGRTLSSCQACMLGTAQSSVQAALSEAMSRLIRLWSGIPPGHFANVSTTNL